jgi:hypothetical protein
MEAKRLIEGAPFDPELAKACAEAFGKASDVITLRKGHDDLGALRLRMAQAVLSKAEASGADVDALFKVAINAALCEPGAQP